VATSCLAGEDVRRKELASQGDFFCKLRSWGYHPNTRSITFFVTRSCEVSQRASGGSSSSEKLFQSGLDNP